MGDFPGLEDVLDIALLDPVRQNNVVSTLCDGPRPPLSQSLAFDPMIQLYYENFHESHPFLLPRRCLDGPLAEHLPPYLLSAMRLIGAGYHYNQSDKDIHRKNAYSAITEKVPATGFKVQAMLLIAIVDHAHGFETRSLQTIEAATKLAIELGMNKSSFGSSFSEGNPTIEESWRRTVWELFVVSAMMAAMGGHEPFPFHSMTELKLPCDEKIYAAADVSSFLAIRSTSADLRSLFRQGKRWSTFKTIGPAGRPWIFLLSRSESKLFVFFSWWWP